MFKALADATRRELLDALSARDGQTLSELVEAKGMTRFGVMKHLRVLEDAGLVVTKKRGREKLHFLNAMPIRLVHDRWIDKYREPIAAMLSEMKHSIERPPEEQFMERVYELYIKCSPERLWEAIIDPTIRSKYAFGVGWYSDWTVGSSYVGIPNHLPDLRIVEGENLEVDPPHKLVQSFRAVWDEAARSEGTSRVTWEIVQVADSCKLTVTHDQLRENANPRLYGGWPMVLSGLKTWLETGELLTTPASLQYVGPNAT